MPLKYFVKQFIFYRTMLLVGLTTYSIVPLIEAGISFQLYIIDSSVLEILRSDYYCYLLLYLTINNIVIYLRYLSFKNKTKNFIFKDDDVIGSITNLTCIRTIEIAPKFGELGSPTIYSPDLLLKGGVEDTLRIFSVYLKLNNIGIKWKNSSYPVIIITLKDHRGDIFQYKFEKSRRDISLYGRRKSRIPDTTSNYLNNVFKTILILINTRQSAGSKIFFPRTFIF